MSRWKRGEKHETGCCCTCLSLGGTQDTTICVNDFKDIVGKKTHRAEREVDQARPEYGRSLRTVNCH